VGVSIYVDYRAGSNDLILPLSKLGLTVEKTTLEFADIMFEGRGVKGAPLLIGIEFKKLEEAVASIRSQRLQGFQMKGMRLDYAHSYLFIEGELLYDAEGMLLRRSGKRLKPMPGQMTISELLKRVYVLHLCGGLNPWWTTTRKDTLQSIAALYHCWTDTDLDKHKSHLGIYTAPTLVPVSDKRRTFFTFPHVGHRLSAAVEKHFKGSLAKATHASVEEWASIELRDDAGKSRRLGTKAATAIVAFCHGK
jgi:ERCC4-type nuclease